MRYGLAMALVMPALLGPGVRNISWNLSLELGFVLFCAYQSQSQQLMTETASQGSIMLAVFILLVPVVELAFGRKFTRKKAVSLVVAIFGISLLAIGGALSPPDDTHTYPDATWAPASAFAHPGGRRQGDVSPASTVRR